MEPKQFTAKDYLKGKVADYTISDNVIESVCFERGVEFMSPVSQSDVSQLKLCYADLLKYIYLQPSTTKSYAIANGTWSQKEGHTILTESDRKRILAEMRGIYEEFGELENIPVVKPTIVVRSGGMRIWNKRRY